MSATPNPPQPKPTVRILHLEDSQVDHALVKYALQRSQMLFDITLVDTMDDLREQLETAPFDILLADYHLPGFTGLEAWKLAHELRPELPCVMLSGAIGEAAAVDVMHRGVSDYLLKDNMHRLAHVVERALEVGESRRAKAFANAELADSRQRLAELAEHLQSSIEQERSDISREIHDDIGGALAAVKLDLAWVGRRAQDEDIQRHIQSAMEMLQHALGASQRIMLNLRPPILDQGLVAAVQWLGTSFERRTGTRVVMRCSAEVIEVSRDLQLVAYRTAQEALTNVAKHTEATAVMIDLSDREGFLTLEVSDNGCGLDAQALRKAKSFGLLGLKERAAKINGWIDVSSSPRGTSVILSAPLQAPGHLPNDNITHRQADDQSDFV